MTLIYIKKNSPQLFLVNWDKDISDPWCKLQVPRTTAFLMGCNA